MLVLDTDILTIVQARRGALYKRVANRIDGFAPDVATIIISFEEQLRGWLAFIAAAKALDRQVTAYDRLTELLEDFADRRVLPFDDAAARVCSRHFDGSTDAAGRWI